MSLPKILSVLSIAAALAGCEDPTVVVGDDSSELTVLCRRGGECGKVMHAANKLDLLLVVDNSFSMEQEQAALAAELPRMMNALLTGDIDGDGTPEVAPVADIHVGVVSTDMGVGTASGANIRGCSTYGDDGVLQPGGYSVTTLDGDLRGGCTPPAESFLSYDAALANTDEAIDELACLATLGLDGCGFEQQLESTLKAVTPSTSAIKYWTETGPRAGLGHGDAANDGFLRNDPNDPSLLAVLMITDEDDCSSRDSSHFIPGDSMIGFNARCHEEAKKGAAGNLYPVQRYIDGLLALRPDHDNLVFFGAIAGVPLDAVSEEALSEIDFADDAQRNAFYDDLLAHPKMQSEIDDKDTPLPDDDGIKPVCDVANGKAYPARRIVEVARGFGSNSVVQSICQESFTSAIEPILQRMAASFSGACIDATPDREDDGKVACDVLWRLPVESVEGVPESCADATFLSPAGEGRAANVCRVAQLPIEDGSAPAGDGWYYDDFSDRTRWCEGDSKQAIVFTGAARPPTEVTILIDCDES